MAGSPDTPRVRAGVAFELLDFRREGDQLVVEGRWSGVRGLRFVRPALLLGERELLATLADKPWAPTEDPWRAVFPWDGADVDAADASLAVAPSVVVPLTPGGVPVASPATPARPQDELDREREARLERERGAAARDHERLVAQLEEAVRDREAAVRTRARMEAEREEALAARTAAEAERDEALAGLQRARAQREQALAAHRALQRQLDRTLAHASASAGAEAAGGGSGETRTGGPSPPADTPGATAADESPSGVRAVPSTAAVGPALHRAEVPRRVTASSFDLWAMRVLGITTALCFLVLLLLVLRAVA